MTLGDGLNVSGSNRGGANVDDDPLRDHETAVVPYRPAGPQTREEFEAESGRVDIVENNDLVELRGEQVKTLKWEHLEGFWESYRNHVQVIVTRNSKTGFVMDARCYFDGRDKGVQIKESGSTFYIDDWECFKTGNYEREVTWFQTRNGDEILSWHKRTGPPEGMKPRESNKEVSGQVALTVSEAGHDFLNGVYKRYGLRNGVAKYRMIREESIYEVAREREQHTNRLKWWLYKCGKKETDYYSIECTDEKPPHDGWIPNGNIGKFPAPKITLNAAAKKASASYDSSWGKTTRNVKDGMPTEIRLIQGEKGICSFTVRTKDLISELEKFIDFEDDEHYTREGKVLAFGCTEPKLRADKGDYLIQVDGRMGTDYNSKMILIRELHQREEATCPIWIFKKKYMHTEMIDEDTMKCLVDVKTLKKQAKSWLKIESKQPTWKLAEKALFVDKMDVLLRIDELDVSHIDKKDDIDSIINQLSEEKVFIWLRKEEARKQRLRKAALQEEEQLEAYYDDKRKEAIDIEYLKKEKIEDGVVRSDLTVLEKFEECNKFFTDDEKNLEPGSGMKPIRIYFTSSFPLIDTAEVLISFSGADWALSDTYYEMQRVEIEEVKNSNCAFIEMIVPEPEDEKQGSKLKKHMFSMQFTIRVGARHYTLPKASDFLKHRYGHLVVYKYNYDDVKSLLDIMSPKMILSHLTRKLLKLLTEAERAKARNPNSSSSNWKELTPWVQIIGMHLADCVAHSPLYRIVNWANGLGMQKKSIEFQIKSNRVEPILKKMEKRKASSLDLKELVFWYLTYDLIPKPRQCYEFVANCFRHAENGDVTTVFTWWALEVKSYVDKWKNAVIETAKQQVRQFVHVQYMAVFINFVHTVAVINNEEKWRAGPRQIQDELAQLRELCKIVDLHESLECRLLNLDLQFAGMGEGRLVPVEYVHLERYMGKVEKAKKWKGFGSSASNSGSAYESVYSQGSEKDKYQSFQKKAAYLRTLKHLYKTVHSRRGAHLDEKQKDSIIHDFCMHWKDYMHEAFSDCDDYMDLVDWLAERDLYRTAVDCLTPRLPETVVEIQDEFSLRSFVLLIEKWPEMLTANVRKALLENFKIRSGPVIKYAFCKGLEEDRENTILLGSQGYFSEIINTQGASAAFKLCCEDVELKDLMIRGAVKALESNVQECTEFEVITRYLDNQFVHLLDERMLDVLHKKMETITSFELTEAQQYQLRTIMQKTFREGNAEKVKLWNSILKQVLPINPEMTILEQIQELCTNLFNVVTMVQDLVSLGDAENLPDRVKEFDTYYKGLVMNVQKSLEEKSITMGVLQVLLEVVDQYKLVSSKVAEFDESLLDQRIQSYLSLAEKKALCGSLTTGYVPRTTDFLSEDMKLFIQFVSQTLGKWTNLTLKNVEEHKMHSVLDQTRPDMEYLKAVEKSLIYKSIWSVIFNGTLKSYQSPTDRQFSDRVYKIFVRAFESFCEPSLKVMRQEHLASYLQKIYEYVVVEPPRKLWETESPRPPNMFPETSVQDEDEDEDSSNSNSEPMIQSPEESAWEPDAVKKWREDQQAMKTAKDEELSKLAEELLKPISIECFTLNDFLAYHLGKKSADVITILAKFGHGGFSKRDLYTRVNTIVLTDAGTNEVNGTYSNENGRYMMKVEPDRSYEIRKVMDEESNEVWWDIARCDRNGITEDMLFFKCMQESYIPPGRSSWQAEQEEFEPSPRFQVYLDNNAHSKICLGTLFGLILGKSKSEIDRLAKGMSNGDLSIKDLLLYFDRMKDVPVDNIQHYLQLFKDCDPFVAEDIHASFALAKEVNFLQDLCKVAEGFAEHSGHEKTYEKDEDRPRPELNEGFVAIKSSVHGVESLMDVADNVKEAATRFNVIKNQLGEMKFTDLQKQWVQQIALNLKVIKDMACEAHLKDDQEFSNLLELLDANQTSQIDAQRSVSLRKVRQLLRTNFIVPTFGNVLDVVQKLSQVQTTEGDLDDLITVSESLDQIARTYNEASGDSLARDKRILGDALEYGFFELVNPSLTSGLEAVELARKCMRMIVDPAMRAESQTNKVVVLKKTKHWKDEFLKKLQSSKPIEKSKTMDDLPETPAILSPPKFKRARTGPTEDSEDDESVITVDTRENLGVSFLLFGGLRLKIHKVEPGSVGEELGFHVGDVLEAINGKICWEPTSALQAFNSEQELPFTVTLKRKPQSAPPGLKRKGSYELMQQKNSTIDPTDVYAHQARMMESVVRSPADNLLTTTVMAKSPSLPDAMASLIRPTALLTETEKLELAEKENEEEAFSDERMTYESVESMLDRLLMAILRNDVELKNNTTELEHKFKLVERICYHRCQYFILGGRAGLIDTKRIFISQSEDNLKSLSIQWEDRLKQFILSTSIMRDEFSWLNYYTVNEVLALNDVLNSSILNCPEELSVECGILKPISGTYRLRPQLIHGRPAYQDTSSSLVLWYNSQSCIWAISEEKDVDTMEVYACCDGQSVSPLSVSGGGWTVYSEEDRAFAKGQNVFIKRIKESRTDQQLQLDVLHHLQFAKPNIDGENVKKQLDSWSIIENEDERLLQTIGQFLDRTLGGVNLEMYREIPDFAKQMSGIEDGKPNLYIADSSKALSSVLNIYLQRNIVPIASQILICSRHTTQEEVEILLRRCFDVASKATLSSGFAPLFCLAFPENLTNDVLKQVLIICQDYLLSDEAMIRWKGVQYCFAMVSCSRDNKLTQRFLQFERDQTEMSLGEAKALYDMILCKTDNKFHEQVYKDRIMPFVSVFSSKNVGAGKSFLIAQWAKNNEAELVRVPANSTDLKPTYVIERLRKKSNSERRAIHFDISSCAGSSVNLILFKLIILHHISASGLRYQVSSKDAFLVELPTTLTISGDEIEMWGREESGTTINLENVDKRFYFTSVNAGLPRKDVTLENNPFVLGQREQFVLKYLRAFKAKSRVADGGLMGTGQDFDPDFEPEAAEEITGEECIELLNEYCPDGIKSRILQKCFLDFAHSQLVQIHANFFFMNVYSPIPGHIHMRQMMMESLTEMAKDFSSRLYNAQSGSLEESTAETRFPLSIRWRSAEVPMILLNQHDVQGYGGDGDISIFCRNLARMRRPSAQNWHQIAIESRYDLVNFEQEERRRVNQLNQQGVVEEGREGKRKKLDLLLKVVGAPDADVRALRVQNIMDKHPNYALTFDNMLKMIAIYFRVKAGIPVLLMGETGCGKTKLMEFLSEVLKITLFKCDVHGGFTSDLIVDFMSKPIAHAQNTDFMVWVFLDEVNTSPEVGLFKEIICDHSLYGEPLPTNLIVLGALNPVRRRKKVSAGLKRKDMAGVETYMNNLVYRVYPLPETMKEYIWNFGALDELDESQYIGEMLNLSFKHDAEDTALARCILKFQHKLSEDDVKDLVDCVRITFQRCLVECQKFTRQVHGGEVSVVSLRDVARCINIFRWFLDHYDYVKYQSYNFREQFYNALQESCILAIAQCYFYRLGGSRKEFADLMDEIITKPVSVVREVKIEQQDPMMDERYRNYMENLEGEDRERFHQRYMRRFQYMAEQNKKRTISKTVKHAKCMPFIRVIGGEQDRYIKLMNIPRGVAKNRSLKENLFMILVCVMTRLPIVLVGKPGSSKTLSMIIVRDNLSASTKNKKLSELGFNDVYLVPFQCSKHSTAGGIKDRWDFAASYQEADPSVRVLIFFDEIGLAEQSPHRPLKVFHQLLEKPVLSFAGLSNWALDSAKMNRAILHNCPVHSLGDLTDTAKAIVESSTENQGLIDMLSRSLVVIAEIYSKIIEMQKIPDFFGARDFYACVQMITTSIKQMDTDEMLVDIPKDLFYEAVVRNFGGMEEEQLRNLLANAMVVSNGEKFVRNEIMQELNQWNGVRAVDRNLFQTRSIKDVVTVGAQARHIMVLTDFETSWQVLFDSNILNNNNTVVIFGSQFRQDLNSSVNLYHSINRVKNCIEAGVVVILLHLEDLHDALYDMLNQRYTRIGKRLYCRIAMGAESVICQVHPHFKCIVVGSKTDAYTGRIPVAFLNRFEKQVIDRRQLMSSTEKIAEKLMMTKLKRFRHDDTHLTAVDRLFPGFMDESIPSLFSVIYGENNELTAPQLAEKALPRILENAYAEVFSRDNSDSDAFQPYTDLVAALETKAMDGGIEKGMHILARTHDRILASEDIENTFTESKLSVKVMQLDEFQTELEFSHFLDAFARQKEKKVLIIQCNHKGGNLPHILHAKHMMEERDRKTLAEMEDEKKNQEEGNDVEDDVEETIAESPGKRTPVSTDEVEEATEDATDAKRSPDTADEPEEAADEEEDSLQDKEVPPDAKKNAATSPTTPAVVQEDTEPKIWVMLVHTPRIKMRAKSSLVGRKTQQRVFPLVFDKIWTSIYVDALIPSEMIGVPSLVELSQSRIPELLKNNPSGVLLRVFRKALTQLRFAQPVRMFEEIQAMAELLSENAWDNGTFLKIMQKRLLAILDTAEFERIISEVVLGRIRNEAESQWIRGSFRDRLVTFTDKLFQTSFARQLKLLYEHGNFNLYNPGFFAKLEDEVGEFAVSELRNFWINTISESRLVTAGTMAISDRPDPIHVPHAYASSFPFSFTLDTWANSKRAEVEAIRVNADQAMVSDLLCKIILAQGWLVDYRYVSQGLMHKLVEDIVEGHIRQFFSMSADDIQMNSNVKMIAKEFLFQSAFENRYVLSEAEKSSSTQPGMGKNEEDIEDALTPTSKAKLADDFAIAEQLRNMRSEISVWDVFPAYWYNTQIISQVLRLFSISHDSVKERILELWQSGISEDKQYSIPFRVGRGLQICVESLSELLQNATLESLPTVTSQIVASQNSVNSLLEWVSGSRVLGDDWNESIKLEWRHVLLKLVVSRYVTIEQDKRGDVFKMLSSRFTESSLFGSPDGFTAIVELTKQFTKDSAELCRVMRRFLELFIFTEAKIELPLIVHLLQMIDPTQESLLGDEYSLTDVAKVHIATELLKLCQNRVIGKEVTDLINARLAEMKHRDDPLAALLLVVIEEKVGRQEIDMEAVKFEDSEKVSIEWLNSMAIAKRWIREYAHSLVSTISKPEEITLEQLGGEEKVAKLMSVISPAEKEFAPLHYYFLKVLFEGGIPWVQAFTRNEHARQHMVSKISIMERVDVVNEVDPYVLAGDAYQTYKDEFVDVYRDQKRNVNLEVNDKTLRACVLALHSSVYRPTTLQGPSESISRWLNTPEMAEIFRKNPYGKFIYRLGTNNFSEASRLKYTSKFDKYSRWITSITSHMCAGLATLPSNHFSIACLKPKKYLQGFMPAMPKDTSEALGNLVGAAAWVCPRGHVYYIGDCTRPWVTAKCHCGADIGGTAHVAQHGNDRLDAKRDDRPSEPGYLLIGTPAEVKEMKTIRSMEVMEIKIMRLLLHTVFLLGNATSVRDFRGQKNQFMPGFRQARRRVDPHQRAPNGAVPANAVPDPNANPDAAVDPNADPEAVNPDAAVDPNAAPAEVNPDAAVDPNAAPAEVNPDAAVDPNAAPAEVNPDAAPAENADANPDANADANPEVANANAEANPADAPAENAAEANADAPAENAAEANADAPAENAAEANADAPAENAEEANADAPAENAEEANADAPAEVNADAPEANADAPDANADPVQIPDGAVAADAARLDAELNEFINPDNAAVAAVVGGDAPDVALVDASDEEVEDPNVILADARDDVEAAADILAEQMLQDAEDAFVEEIHENQQFDGFGDPALDPNNLNANGLNFGGARNLAGDAPFEAEPNARAPRNPRRRLGDRPVEPKAVDYSDKSDIAKLMQGHGFGKSLQNYLYGQCCGYLEQLSVVLNINAEETVLFLHKVIDKFLETFESNFGSEGILDLNEENRDAFEKYFCSEVIQPLLPARESVENLRKAHLETNELLAELWEKTDLRSDEGIVFRQKSLPNLMLTTRKVDFEQFSMALCTEAENKIKFPSLYALATARPSIWVIKYLPAMHAWCKIIMQRFNRKMTRDDAKQMTIQDVLDMIETENWGNKADYYDKWQDFVECWNEIYRLINIDDHTRLDELRNDCVHIYRFITNFSKDPKDVKVAFCCPDEQDEGLITNTIVDHLVSVHNKFLTAAGALSSGPMPAMSSDTCVAVPKREAAAPIMNSDTCTTQNLVDVDKDTVNEIIRSHCIRSLEFGGGSKLSFDMQALEGDIRDRFVLGKGEVRAMLPFFEFAGTARVESIFDTTGLPKDRLDPDFLKTATSYQSGLERQKALEVVEETILLLGRLGVDAQGDMPIYSFMRDVLRMNKEDWSLFNLNGSGDEIQLKHLHCIWSYLQKVIIYEDPKRLKVPDGTMEIYQEELAEDLSNGLNDFMKSIALADFEELVFAWFDVLKSLGTEKRDVDQEWSVWIGAKYENEKVLEKLPDIRLSHCGTAYEFIANEFFRIMKGRDDEDENAE